MHCDQLPSGQCALWHDRTPNHVYCDQVDHLTMCAVIKLTIWLYALWIGQPPEQVRCDQVEHLTMSTETRVDQRRMYAV